MTEQSGRWIRVSTGGQDEANQVPDIEQYESSRGYDVAETYTVHGKSAYHGDQQQWIDQALADARAGKITVLVVWHSDRLERRGGLALLNLLAEFKAAGCRVESTKEPALGALDMGGQLTTFIAGIMAQEESAHKADRYESITLPRLMEGGGVLGKPPFGYTIAGAKYGKQLVPTAGGMKYVPEIYRMVIAGKSLRTIAHWLDSEGVMPVESPTTKCRVCRVTQKAHDGDHAFLSPGWNEGSIGQLIRTTTYRGVRKFRSDEFECARIVSDETWDAANTAMNSRPKRGAVDVSNRALLAGVLFCGKCHGPMYKTKSGRTADLYYYRCAGSGAKRKSECKNMVKLTELDAAVSLAVETHASDDYRVRQQGAGTDAEALAGIKIALRKLPSLDLPEAVEDARRAELRAARAELESAAADPGWVTDGTVGDHWAKLSTDAERRDMLLGRVKVFADNHRRGPTGGLLLRFEGHLFQSI